jgi:hypothetical protein
MQCRSGGVVALFVVALSACARDGATNGDVVRADSAGVRIITSGAVDRDLAWTFDSVDVLRDSAGEAWIFEGVTTRRVVADRAGRAYVLTREPSIVRFARDGRYDRSFGRKGGAPGEMQFPTALIVQGDSLAVLDPVRGGLVRFGPGLEPIPDIPLRDGLADVNAIAFRSGGLWVQRRTFENGALQVALYGDTLDGAPLLSLPAAATRPVSGCGGRINLSLPPFFSPEITWVAERGRLLANVGPRYELALFDGSRLFASVRRVLESRVPTEADVRRLYPNGFQVQTSRGSGCTFEMDDLLRSPGVAEVLPLVHGLALLSDGTIWVQRSLRDESPAILDVFTSDGTYAGTLRGLRLPLALLPNGELLVPRDDEDSGGQHILRMRVTR